MPVDTEGLAIEYIPIAKTTARIFVKMYPYIDADSFFSEAMYALFRAARVWLPGQGTTPKTFFIFVIRQRLRAFVRKWLEHPCGMTKPTGRKAKRYGNAIPSRADVCCLSQQTDSLPLLAHIVESRPESFDRDLWLDINQKLNGRELDYVTRVYRDQETMRERAQKDGCDEKIVRKLVKRGLAKLQEVYANGALEAD